MALNRTSSVYFGSQDDDIVDYLDEYIRETFSSYVKRLIRGDMVEHLGLSAQKKSYIKAYTEEATKEYLSTYTKNHLDALVKDYIKTTMREGFTVKESDPFYSNRIGASDTTPDITAEQNKLKTDSNALDTHSNVDKNIRDLLGNQLKNNI